MRNKSYLKGLKDVQLKFAYFVMSSDSYESMCLDFKAWLDSYVESVSKELEEGVRQYD